LRIGLIWEDEDNFYIGFVAGTKLFMQLVPNGTLNDNKWEKSRSDIHYSLIVMQCYWNLAVKFDNILSDADK
jgi:hypothetical protein